jgi:hypothetical protein
MCLEAVVTTVAVDSEPRAVEAMGRSIGLWRQMTDHARKRVAGNPVLLVDLHFQDSEWWRWILHQGPKPIRARVADEHLAIGNAATLLREILMEAWAIGRSNPQAARLVFGMYPAVVAAIVELQASDIDSIAVTYAGNLQLRWADNAVFWKNLLLAALGDSDDAVAAVHMHSLQLLGNEDIPPHG